MRNRDFKTRERSENRRKLDVALRRLTGDGLTSEQRKKICDALGSYQQYTIQLTNTPTVTLDVAAPSGRTVIRSIFGDPNGLPRGPTATLVRCNGEEICNTVYIYLPSGGKIHESKNEK